MPEIQLLPSGTFAVRFRGFVSARKRHELMLDELGENSAEWSIDPIRQKLVNRKGSKMIEDTVGAEVGLFDSDFGGRAEFADGIHSPSFTTDQSTPACLYTNETTKKGCLGWIDPNQAGSVACHKQLGNNFGSRHYSLASGTEVNMKILPLWFENATTILGRHSSVAQRECSAAGSRRWIEVGNRLYLPNAQGTPLWTDKAYNSGTGAGSTKEYIYPWGNLMPLHLGKAQLAAATGASDNNWKDGDAFFVSCQFEYEDGSRSIPFIPRPQGILTADGSTTIAAVALGTGAASDLRNGQVVVGTIGGTSYYKTITYTSLPYGGPGVKYLLLLRSNKTNLSSTSSPFAASPDDLNVIVKLPNGTSTYVDSAGDDDSLVTDQRVIDSLLSMWCPQAQYAVGADGRVVVGGNVRQNPAAIVIAPIGINSFGDVNIAETNSTMFGSSQVFVKVSTTTLTLRFVASGGSFPAAVSADVALTITNKTLQEVVDYINEVTAITANHARWGAQLAPGVDGALLATNLADTTGGTDWFGDDAMITSGGSGNMRCFGPSFPGVLYFSQTYMATIKKDAQALVMTSASPSVPGGNANSFFLDKSTNWKYPPSAKCGRLMGIAPITGRNGVVCVAFYEKGWYVLRNTVSGGSGQDADYHLVAIDEYDGLVSHRTIDAGPGFCGGMSPQGYSITDGDNKVLISRDVWDAKLAQGEWGNEMTSAINAASKGTQDHYFAAKILGSKLAVTYRTSSLFTYANRRIEYEFGEGSDSLGIAGMLRQSDTGRPVPYGWSCPIKTHSFSVMGRYENSTGPHNFGCDESTNGSTGNGVLFEFDTGGADRAGGYGSAAGSGWSALAYSATIPAPTHNFINLLSLAARYIKASSGLSIIIYADGPTSPGTRSDSKVLTLGSSGANLYSEIQSNIPNGVRGNYSTVEFAIWDDGTNSGTASEVGLLDVPYQLVERTVLT